MDRKGDASMSKKDVIYFFQLSDDADLSADYVSDPFTVKTLDNIGILIEVTGVTDNTGTFEVQKRYKSAKNEGTYTDWVTITFSTGLTLGDADTTHEFFMRQINPCQLRVKFTAAGGTPDGIANIYVSACSVGG